MKTTSFIDQKRPHVRHHFLRLMNFCLSCLLILTVFPTHVLAIEPLDPDHACSLTIEYEYMETRIPGAEFDIYYLASVDAYVNFTLTPDFAGYPVKVNDNTAEEWGKLSETLKTLVNADGLSPAYTKTTDANGEFTLTGLKTGLYLVIGKKCTIDGMTYHALPTVVALPGTDPDYQTWIYDITASPKVSAEPVSPEEEWVSRKVLKAWNDNGKTELRPTEITIHLLCDGEIYDTVTLNAASDWRYTWEKLPVYDDNDAKIEWSVAEATVPADYTVKIEKDGITFLVTNTYDTPPDDPPPPPLPDAGVLWWPVPVLAFGGMICLIIGLLRRRRWN